MPFKKCNDINVYYEIQGAGPPLVLISGLGGDHFFWQHSIPVLSRYFQVVTFDTRGIGQTDAPNDPYTIELFADDLHALLQELQMDKPCLLGFSMGGNIALSFALKYPDKVAKLILAATHAGMNEQIRMFVDAVLDVYEKGITTGQLFHLICPWLFSNSFLSDPRNADYFKYDEDAPDQQPLYAWKNQYLAQRAFHVVEDICNIRLPTLIIAGELDLFGTVEDAKVLNDRINHSILKVVPASGHLFNYENPDLFHQYVVDFMLHG